MQSMCLGTKSTLCCCAVTWETEADVSMQCLGVFFCAVASPFGFILSTAIAYLQPKPTRTVKIMCNAQNIECRLLDPEADLGNSKLPAENSSWGFGYLHHYSALSRKPQGSAGSHKEGKWKAFCWKLSASTVEQSTE